MDKGRKLPQVIEDMLWHFAEPHATGLTGQHDPQNSHALENVGFAGLAMASSLSEVGVRGCRCVRVQDVIVAWPVEHMHPRLDGL